MKSKPDTNVLDPFAGRGSIPFEAVRSGCNSYALEYNPVAYVILKATLDFSSRYGKKLLEDVRKWSDWMLHSVEEDVGSYYPKEVLTYIWNWTVKCHHSGKHALLRKDWSLSKKRGVYMAPYGNGVRVVKGEVPTLRNLKRGTGNCTSCNRTIGEKYIKEEFKKHFADQPNGIGLKLVIAVQPGRGGKEYRVATDKEEAMANVAERALAERWEGLVGDGLIPTESLPPYSTVRASSFGVRYWDQLYNPRQMLRVACLVSKVKEVRSRVAETEGEEYAKAVSTCLALVTDKFADYNSRVTRWHSRNEQISNTLGFRRPSIGSDFPEVNPFVKTSGSLLNMISDVLDGLSMATSTLEGLESKIHVRYGSVLDLPYEKQQFDLVVTDPPYDDDFQYGELADYFYVWLKRCVGDLYPEAFRYRTLWEEAVSEEVSKDPNRFHNVTNKNEAADKHYEALLNASFGEISRVLSDDGVLVVFFSHSTTAAWARLLKAMILAEFTIKRAWPVHTEQAERVTARGAEVIDTSLLVVARKREGNEVGYLEVLRPKILDTVRAFVKNLVKDQGDLGWADLLNTSIGPALELLTQYKEVRSARGGLEVVDILDEVSKGVTQAMLETMLGRSVRPDVLSCLYLLLRTTKFDSAIFEKLPFDYVRRVCLSLSSNLEVDDAKSQHIISEVTEKGKKYIQVLYPTAQEDMDTLLSKRGLNLREPASKELLAVDVAHLSEVAYAKGGKTKLLEVICNLDEGLLNNAHAILEALHKALPDKDGEREVIRPVLDVWSEAIQACKELTSAKPQKRLDEY